MKTDSSNTQDSVSDVALYSVQQREQSDWKQEENVPGFHYRGGFILSSLSLSAALTPVPGVALALEMIAEVRKVSLSCCSLHL